MKTKTWILAILAFFIVSVGNATDFPAMNVIPVEANKAMLAYKAPTAATLEVTLTDCNGEVLYFKRTNQKETEYNQVFDFAELGDGSYCMCVNYGNRSVKRNLLLDGESISVGAPMRCYEPYFCLEEKMLNISFFNSPQKPVYVNIYQDGKHIDGFKLGKDLAIQKRLYLSKLKAGDYEVVVTDYITDHKFLAEL
ncbi:hypothetical protein [Maribellus sediminis]|uniref:hypothetical protein n=1 Tax=Maribellus sediminis TaxID=2696285 RepID=UPI00143121C9|nr:hypothetical protein [Maribellus sediminis]